MKKEPIVIEGQQIGRLKASWLLFKEAWRYLKLDKEMLWIPVITAVLNIFLFGVLVTLFVLVVLSGDVTLSVDGDPSSPLELMFIFLAYVVGAFTLALSQAGITHTVYTRAHGGDATLGQSLKTAFSHWGSLLLWSIITSTVGLLLRMIAERSELLGRIVVLVIGIAWSVLTYFVVPAMVIDKTSAFASIGKSGQIFKATWGETIVSNISLGLAFLVIHVLAIFSMTGLVIASIAVELPWLVLVIAIVYFVFVFGAALVQSTLEGVLKTLLYIYAAEGTVPENFNRELLEKMMARKNPIPPVRPEHNMVNTNV